MAEIALHEYVRQMKQLIKEGRYDEVVAHGRHILKQYPKYLEVYRVLGEAMLEAGQEDQAENMFSRVLSGDPENFVAHAGMSVIYDRRGDLDKALWHMERAFEISPDNPAIRNELRRLYGRKTGVEPGRLDLTPATLARLYARGGRYRRAIEEFRSLLEENPDRVDLQVALAEALWKNEQRIQAEELCLGILEQLPFCLKANLILGEIYTRTGRKEGKECLAKAEALDPENRVAAALFGDESPLPLREVHIERLEYSPPEEERPSWMPEAPTTEIEVAPETQIEIPAWLEEISGGEEAPTPAEEEEEEVGLEVPSWLGEPGLEEIGEEPSPPLEEPAPPEPEAEAPAEAVPPPEPAEIPDWIREMAPPEVKREEERAETPAPPPEPAEIPDWLKEMAPPEVKEEAAPTTPPAEAAEAVPEWLAEAISLTEEKPPVPEMPAEEGIPEWPAEPTPEEAPPPEEPTPPPGPEAPEWAEQLEEPKAPEIPEWLTAAPPPQEEPAPAEPVEPAIPDWLAEAAMPEEIPASEPPIPEVPRSPVPTEEEAFGWTGFEAEEEAPPPPEAPTPPEEGFGWTEFEAAAEVEAPPTEVTPTEAPPETAAEVPPPVEIAPEPVTERLPGEAPPAPEAVEEALPEAPTDLEALWDHLRAHPRDHEARLTLARAMWQAGRYEESLEAYSRLLRANKLVDEVLADLEGYAEERPSDASLLRVLGDAYMRADRLTEALEAYREALKNL